MEEIIQAIKKIAQDVKEDKLTLEEIKEQTVSNYLYTKDLPDPDLILRTSGEERISNFLYHALAILDCILLMYTGLRFKNRFFTSN